MIYYFHGVERLQLMFDSPNKLAVFVCMVIPLTVYLAFRCPLRNIWWQMAFLSLVALCLSLEAILVQTYSRGGFVAFGLSMAVLFWCGLRKGSLMMCGALVALMLIVPKAVERAVDVNLISDLSIWHRLLLWKGVCGMAVNAFPFGVGRDVGPVFIAWYQALDKHQPYLTAVSDPLTVAARYGLPILFIVLSVVLAVLLALADVARKRHLAFSAALTASGVSFLVAGIFSTFYTTPVLMGCFAAVVSGAAVIVIWKDRRCLWPALVKASSVSMVACLIIGIVGIWVVKTNPIRIDYRFGGDQNCCAVRIGGGRDQGVIAYLFDQTETSLEEEGRQSIRSILKDGWPMVLIGVEPDETGLIRARDVVREIEAKYPAHPIRLIGQNCGGRFALILASESNRVDRVASIGAFASCPIRAISPNDSLCSKSNLVVKAVNGANDWRTNPQDALMIERKCESVGIACEPVIVAGVGNRLDQKRGGVLSELIMWLRE